MCAQTLVCVTFGALCLGCPEFSAEFEQFSMSHRFLEFFCFHESLGFVDPLKVFFNGFCKYQKKGFVLFYVVFCFVLFGFVWFFSRYFGQMGNNGRKHTVHCMFLRGRFLMIFWMAKKVAPRTKKYLPFAGSITFSGLGASLSIFRY